MGVASEVRAPCEPGRPRAAGRAQLVAARVTILIIILIIFIARRPGGRARATRALSPISKLQQRRPDHCEHTNAPLGRRANGASANGGSQSTQLNPAD